jgi:hypothetical protein
MKHMQTAKIWKKKKCNCFLQKTASLNNAKSLLAQAVIQDSDLSLQFGAGGAVGPFAFPVVPGFCKTKEQPKTNN